MNPPRLRFTVRTLMMVVAGAAFALALFLFASSRTNRDFTGIRSTESNFLKDVAEPIVMVDGIGWMDGGSFGLVFEDSKQVVRQVCLEDDLDDNQYLIFGSAVPRAGKRVRIGGIDERAFLGMLQRWDRTTYPDKLKFLSTTKLAQEQTYRGIAVVIMRKLLRRN